MSTPWSSTTSDILTFTKAGNEFQSASSSFASSSSSFSSLFLTFLATAQALNVDILPLTWQPMLDALGEGGTAEIRQSIINLQMNFALKRAKPCLGHQELLMLHAMIMELIVLRSPALKDHPNMPGIEGICWDIPRDEEKVWPVLVFEKARFGDLRKFMSGDDGKKLGFGERIGICAGIALAVRDMHGANIIHGDIKPDNVLIFANGDAGFTPKVSDFGFSTLLTQANEIIYMPQSGHWTAPEWHHRGFRRESAKTMDVFSFGMVCLWVLLYNSSQGNDRSFVHDVEASGNVLSFALELVSNARYEETEKMKLQRLFEYTLPDDPKSRGSSFNNVLEILIGQKVSPFDLALNDLPPTRDSFKIESSFIQLLMAHYKVRNFVALCLQDSVAGCRSESHLISGLSLCCFLGFGIARSTNFTPTLMNPSNFSPESFANLIDSIKSDNKPQEFHGRNYRWLDDEGYFSNLALSDIYLEQGQLEEAEKQYRRELGDFEQALGSIHTLVQIVRRQLSDLLFLKGNFREVEELQKLLIESSALHGGLDIEVYKSDLALLYNRQGRYDEAERLCLEVLGQRPAGLLHGEYADHLFTVSILASVYSFSGRLKDAEDLEAQLLARDLKYLGEEHISTLVSMSNLATTYTTQGRYEKAQELEEQALKLARRLVGEKSIVAATIESNLAHIYFEYGDWCKTEQMSMRSISTHEEILGVDHLETLREIHAMGEFCLGQRLWEKAEGFLSDVAARRERVLGCEHSDTLFSKAKLVTAYYSEGKVEEAKELQIHIVHAREQSLGAEDQLTLESKSDQAFLYGQLGLWLESEQLFQTVLKAQNRLLGVDSPATLRVMKDLAGMYYDQTKWYKAVNVYRQILEKSRLAMGPTDDFTLSVMQRLAITYVDLCFWSEAIDLQNQIVSLSTSYGATVKALQGLSCFYVLKGDIESLAVDRRIVTLQTQELGSDHPETLESLLTLSNSLASKGLWEESVEIVERVFDGRKRTLGSEHQLTMQCGLRLARILWRAWRKKEAVEMMRNTITLETKVLGEDDTDTDAAIDELEAWLHDL